MPLGSTELLIVLVIVLLLFGAGRITQVARELGQGIRAFKEEVNAEPASSAADTETTQ